MPETIDRRGSADETVCTARRLQIDTDQAWEAWTTSSGLQAWWWHEEPGVSYAADPWVGGRYRIHSASSGLGVRGTVLVADRPLRLLLQWRWLGPQMPPVDGLVQVTFAVEDGEVVVALEETMPPGAPTVAFQSRWNTVMDALARIEPGAARRESR